MGTLVLSVCGAVLAWFVQLYQLPVYTGNHETLQLLLRSGRASAGSVPSGLMESLPWFYSMLFV